MSPGPHSLALGRTPEDDLSTSPGVLFDEKLPGPLYGLPGVDVHTCYLPLTWRAIRNAELPIHRLPAEVLLHIFEYFLVRGHPMLGYGSYPVFQEPIRPSGWAPLMGVCRHWCALIRTASRFWRDLVVSKDTRHAWIDIVLRRVGTAPIGVWIKTPYPNVQPVLQELMKHRDHIESFNYRRADDGPVGPALLEFFGSCPFPILKSLLIELHEEVSSPPEVGIFQGPCTQLETLSLHFTAVPWTRSVLANLKTLTLYGCVPSMSSTLSFADFLEILEHGQQLEYIAIVEFLDAILHPQPSDSHTRVVTLPKLRHLICSDYHVTLLVTHLLSPNIREFSLIKLVDNIDDPSATYADMFPSGLTSIPFFSTVTSVRIALRGTEHNMSSSDSSLSFCAWGSVDWSPVMERQLLQLPTLLSSALTELSIVGRLTDIGCATWDVVLDSFPALEALEVDKFSDAITIIRPLRTLAAHSSSGAASADSGSGGRTGPIRCRHLRRLKIIVSECAWSPTSMEELLECLEFRKANGAADFSGSGLTLGQMGKGTIMAVFKVYGKRLSAVTAQAYQLRP